MTEKIVRIGGASGFWGDSSVACAQLVRRGQVDYLVFDYLAELTMSILSVARAKSPDAGYATDFVDVAMKSVIRDIAAKGIKVVSNAGGVNPAGCAAALAKLAAEAGVKLRIAIVEGDDVLPRIAELRAAGVREMYSGAELPQKILSANAYLGALPIARALAAGADVVITGRCVDSAVALGPLIHEFGWREDDYDRLAAGSLAGHIAECGCQATGGLFTDWESVPRWDDIGYPILECHADGSFVVTKAPGTGGLVSRAVVAEQMLYEMGDPGAYLLPDVACDFTGVQIEEIGPDRVRVSGARGLAPTPTYKVCATYPDGYRCTAILNIIGIAAAQKAQRTAEAILARTRAIFPRTRAARLFREPHRSARRRKRLRSARAHRRYARSGDAPRGRPRKARGAGNFLARDRAGRHVLVAGHHRHGRRPAQGDARGEALFLPARKIAMRGERHAGRRARAGRRSRSGAPTPGTRARARRSRPKPGRRRARPGQCRCCGSPGAAQATRAIPPTSASSPAAPSFCRCCARS